jgi:hypothetical protein
VWRMLLVLVLSRLLVGPPTLDLEVKQVPFATLYIRHLDDGLQMGPKHVEAWKHNKVKKIVHRVGLFFKHNSRCTVKQT